MNIQKTNISQSKSSLLTNFTQNRLFYVYMKVLEQYQSISINFNQQLTVYQAKISALQSFQKKYYSNIDGNYSTYLIYPARKNGHKYKDLPALEETQKIDKTNLKFFFLEKIIKNQERSIISQIIIDKKIKDKELRCEDQKHCFLSLCI